MHTTVELIPQARSTFNISGSSTKANTIHEMQHDLKPGVKG